MTNELVLSGISDIYSQLGEMTKEIKAISSTEALKVFLTKIKAMRQYWKTMGYIYKMRIELLQLEITCIIRLFEIDKETKGFQKGMGNFFIENGEDVLLYLNKYPDCITAKQIYNKHITDLALKQAKQLGINTGMGAQDYVARSVDSKGHYYSVQEAMKVIIDDLSTRNKPFTIDKVGDELIDIVSGGNKDYKNVISEYKNGVNEICRTAILKCKIDTIGERQAPRFVTYQDEYNGNTEYLRIPFERASLIQLKHMIDLREEQLKQDTIALDNLKAIYKELLSLSKGEKDARSISAILKANI